MSPSRLTVLALAGLLLAQALAQVAPIAAAQTGGVQGTDLVPVSLTLDRAIAGQGTTVTLLVTNQGSQTFSSQRGWQVVFTYGGNGQISGSTCIVQAAVPEQSACYQTIPSGDPRNTIRPGETVRIEFSWTPDAETHAGRGTMYATIQPLGCTSTAPNDPFTCTGPDAATGNNQKDFVVLVYRAGVRAVPLFAAPPHDSSPNSYWNYADVKEDCPAGAAVAPKSCKPQPGAVVKFAYNVINQGNTVDSFTARVMDGQPSPNLSARGYRVFFSPNPIALDAGQAGVVEMQVVVPDAEEANTLINVNSTPDVHVQWESSLQPGVTTADPLRDGDRDAREPCTDALDAQELCQNPIFPSLVVGVKRDVNVTTDEARRLVRTGTQAVFNVIINNTGNFVDAYDVAIDYANSAINSSWQPLFPSVVTREASESASVSISLLPPANATKGPHPFDVTVQSRGDASEKAFRRITFVADLEQRFGLAAGADQGLIRVVPAQTASYTLRLANTGNGPDNVTLSLSTPPFGWSATLSDRAIQVPAFATVPIHLNVTPPANTPEGAEATFLVEAVSQGPPGVASNQRARTSVNATLVVLRGPNLEVTPSNCATLPCSGFIDPGATREYEMVVRNTGNVRDNFTVALDAANRDLAWTATVTPSHLVLDPLQQGTVRVSLRAPTSGAVGETTKVFVNVASTVNEATVKQVAVEGRVSGPDLFVATLAANATTPYMGDPLELSVVLGNAGNKPPQTNVTLKLYWVPQGGSPQPIGERTYAPGDLPGGRRLAESIVWDTTGVEGPGAVVARIDEDGAVQEIDETAASNEATRALTLRVFDIRLVPPEPLSGRPGERVSYTEDPHVFLVEYRGNQPTEPVDILVESEHGWTSNRLSLALPQGSPIPILVDFAVPASPGVPRDALRVSVVPTLRPGAVVTAAVTTTVLDEEKPRFRGVVATPSSVTLGGEVTVRADVEDATGLSSVRAVVVTPENVTESLTLLPHPDGGWRHTQRWTVAGTYRLYVEAVDASDNANVNATRDAAVTFAVTPGSAPAIELASGQKTTLRTGTPIRFNVTDPLGVARATYSIRGVSYDLPRPFTLDTSAFTAGAVDVTVTAENVYGVKSSASFSFTVDNTPPGILGVTVTPEKPKANEDVVVRIETDGTVDAVDVLVKRGGQVVETRAAERKGQSAFELLLNPATGDYVLDVTAKDEAGNAKLEQGAVVFSAKPASAIPGPGLLGALAAAAVALALAGVRRRRG